MPWINAPPPEWRAVHGDATCQRHGARARGRTRGSRGVEAGRSQAIVSETIIVSVIIGGEMRKPSELHARDREWDALVDFVADPSVGATLGLVYGRRRQGQTLMLELLAEATCLRAPRGFARVAGVRQLARRDRCPARSRARDARDSAGDHRRVSQPRGAEPSAPVDDPNRAQSAQPRRTARAYQADPVRQCADRHAGPARWRCTAARRQPATGTVKGAAWSSNWVWYSSS
jgi:hypothetical protein